MKNGKFEAIPHYYKRDNSMVEALASHLVSNNLHNFKSVLLQLLTFFLRN